MNVILVLFLLLSPVSEQQSIPSVVQYSVSLPGAPFSINLLSGKVWKIDQLYVNSVRVQDSLLTPLRYTFQSNNTFILTDGTNIDQLRWETNAAQSEIYIKNPATNAVEHTFQIQYLNATHFVFVEQQADASTGQPVIVEYRLIPVP